MSDDAVTPDLDAVVEELADGRRGFHRIPKELSADEAAELRRKGLEARSHGHRNTVFVEIGNRLFTSGIGDIPRIHPAHCLINRCSI